MGGEGLIENLPDPIADAIIKKKGWGMKGSQAMKDKMARLRAMRKK
jgi:hypothetical protein